MLYKDPILKPHRLKDSVKAVQKSLQESPDFSYAFAKFSIVIITREKKIVYFFNDNFSKISEYNPAKLIEEDDAATLHGYFLKPNRYVYQLG